MLIGGIETGGTKTTCAIGSENGEIIEKETFPTKQPAETFIKIADFFSNKKIDRIGVGAFGPIQVDDKKELYGTIFETPKTGWSNVSLLEEIKKFVSTPVVIDTDVNAAVYGEFKWGEGQTHDSCVYFTVGTGIGLGAIVNKKIIHGSLHPEAGHMFVKRHWNETFSGGCPYHKDCLEGLASGTAMKNKWGKSCDDIENEQAWDIEAYYLAQAALNATYAYSPDKIILGGGVMNKKGLISKIRDEFNYLLNGYLKKDFIYSDSFITLPGLGENSGIKGAIALANDKLSNQ